MTVSRRLSVLESSLTPTQRVLAWLDEAHACGSVDAYVTSMLDQPPDAFPNHRLAREAVTATRTSRRRHAAEPADDPDGLKTSRAPCFAAAMAPASL